MESIDRFSNWPKNCYSLLHVEHESQIFKAKPELLGVKRNGPELKMAFQRKPLGAIDLEVL